METSVGCIDWDEASTVDEGRLAGTVICAGALLGLAGTISTVFPFSFLGVVSFGLALVFGALVFRKRPESRLVAAATLWFGSLGGAACIAILWFNHSGLGHSDVWDVQGSVGLVGTGLALSGAVIGRHQNPLAGSALP